MADRSVSRRADVVLSCLVFALGSGTIVQGRRLPPSAFDPLGPGGIPIGIGVLLCILGAWIGIAAMTGRSVGGGQRMFSGLEEDTDPDQPLRWSRSLIVYLLSLVYLFALPLKAIEFFPATAVYIVTLLVFLGERNWKSLVLSVPLSIGFAYALDQIFRRVLYVNLP